MSERAPEGIEGQDGSAGAIKGNRGHGQKITARGLLAMLAEQNYKCALTGRELSPQTAALDHKVPLSSGGDNTLANVQVVHKDANQAKSAMSHDAFIAICREVVRYADSQ